MCPPTQTVGTTLKESTWHWGRKFGLDRFWLTALSCWIALDLVVVWEPGTLLLEDLLGSYLCSWSSSGNSAAPPTGGSHTGNWPSGLGRNTGIRFHSCHQGDVFKTIGFYGPKYTCCMTSRSRTVKLSYVVRAVLDDTTRGQTRRRNIPFWLLKCCWSPASYSGANVCCCAVKHQKDGGIPDFRPS